MQNRKNTVAIILSAGMGSRMGLDVTKQSIMLSGKTVLRRCLEVFDASEYVDSMVVVYKENEFDFVNKECHSLKKPFTLVKGGNCRAESAALGFRAAEDTADYVMIHDAARCLVTCDDISSVINAAYKHGAASASRRITDTVKKCDAEGKIRATLSRDELRVVQTPQPFLKDIYNEALANATSLDGTVTDDNMLVENIGIKPYCVDTSSENIKITTREDIALAEFIINKRREL